MAKGPQNKDERKNAMAITEDACDQVMVNGIAVDESQLWIVEFYWSEEGFNHDLSLWFLRWNKSVHVKWLSEFRNRMVAGSSRIPDRLDFAGVRLMIEHPIADDTPTTGKQATPLMVRPLVRVHPAHSVLKNKIECEIRECDSARLLQCLYGSLP